MEYEDVPFDRCPSHEQTGHVEDRRAYEPPHVARARYLRPDVAETEVTKMQWNVDQLGHEPDDQQCDDDMIVERLSQRSFSEQIVEKDQGTSDGWNFEDQKNPELRCRRQGERRRWRRLRFVVAYVMGEISVHP